MSSILILLPLEGRRLQYVLTCPVEERWLYLLRWLTEKNIGMCTQEEYQNPDLLKAQSLYCVISGSKASQGEVEDSYLLFQVLQLSDWEGEKPIPQYTAIVGNLAWMLITDKVGDGKDKDGETPSPEAEPSKDILLGSGLCSL